MTEFAIFAFAITIGFSLGRLGRTQGVRYHRLRDGNWNCMMVIDDNIVVSGGQPTKSEAFSKAWRMLIELVGNPGN